MEPVQSIGSKILIVSRQSMCTVLVSLQTLVYSSLWTCRPSCSSPPASHAQVSGSRRGDVQWTSAKALENKLATTTIPVREVIGERRVGYFIRAPRCNNSGHGLKSMQSPVELEEICITEVRQVNAQWPKKIALRI